MTKELTYTKALEIAIDTLGEGEVAEKLDALKKSLEKKSKAKSAKVVEGRADYDARVLAQVVGKVSASDVLRADMDFFGSVPKITASFTRLIDGGKVVKSTEKGKSFYSIAE